MAKQENQVSLSAQQLINQVRQVVVGKDAVLLWVLAAMLAGGHILLEDIPGVGKTTMALAYSKTLGLSYNRVQFTPDLLPADVTGTRVFRQQTGEFEFIPGPVFTNILLADEINRTSPKTQSALLEVMEERVVTVDGISRKLPEPFMVIATQNPTGYIGTYPLPEAQLDRFLMKITSII